MDIQQLAEIVSKALQRYKMLAAFNCAGLDEIQNARHQIEYERACKELLEARKALRLAIENEDKS